jgi:hypothetical protein
MSRPKALKEKLDRVLSAWQMLAPTKTFGGYTLAQFIALTQPSIDTRNVIHELEVQLGAEKSNRNNADKVTNKGIKQVVSGVLSDPTEGPDSDLYGAMGYTRESERQSGLTQKNKPAPKT